MGAELGKALAAIGCHGPLDQVERLVTAVPGDNHGRVRWLDFLVYLDRLGTSISQTSDLAKLPLPDLQSLRSGCLKASVGVEELQRRLQAVSNQQDMQDLMAELGLERAEAASWVKAWEVHGAEGFLLLLPLGEAAPSESSRRAWHARCVDAVKLYRRDLAHAFTTWRPDSKMKSEDFHMCCSEVLAADLSEEDICDLGLLARGREADGYLIDGASILRLAD